MAWEKLRLAVLGLTKIEAPFRTGCHARGYWATISGTDGFAIFLTRVSPLTVFGPKAQGLQGRPRLLDQVPFGYR